MNAEQHKFLFHEKEKLEDYYINAANLFSRILTNWLYGLNVAGLAGLLTLINAGCIDKKVVFSKALFFLLSLGFCIISSAIEWYRFDRNIQILRGSFGDLQKEDKCWLCCVNICKILGYIFLIIGAILLFQ